MNVNGFNVRLSHKVFSFIRTESRFFEISEAKILTDDITSRLISEAVPVPDSTVADIVAQASSKTKEQKPRGKASMIRRFEKEAAI